MYLYNMTKFYWICVLFVTIVAIDATAFDTFHCKAATCQEFYYGLKNFARQKDYVNVCYDTVNSLQGISQKYGKCFEQTTKKLNPACIHALAMTMKSCVFGLRDIPIFYARYYCGYRLMQNCAKHIGLERFPFNTDYERNEYNSV